MGSVGVSPVVSALTECNRGDAVLPSVVSSDTNVLNLLVIIRG